MSGIYIHIPFCKQKCHYCNFYSSVSPQKKSEFVQALIAEMSFRKGYLNNETIETVYFGGGTPSMLNRSELNAIFKALHQNFSISNNAEITLEANPENITQKYLKELLEIGVNRLSMGIQSFNDEDLWFLRRVHTAKQAITAVKSAQDIGFKNISLDLIYGLPNSTLTSWEQNLNQFFKLNVEHLSAYHLTYEEGTTLYQKLKKQKINAVEETMSLNQFQLLMEAVSCNHFEMYEISNFAKNRLYSKHNSSYWLQKPYLGLGPSAHSFNLQQREWNVSNINHYIKGIINNNRNYEQETLNSNDLINEYIMTRLRTKWGIGKTDFSNRFYTLEWHELLRKSQPYINDNNLILENDTLKLTNKGIFISDKILEDLIIV